MQDGDRGAELLQLRPAVRALLQMSLQPSRGTRVQHAVDVGRELIAEAAVSVKQEHHQEPSLEGRKRDGKSSPRARRKSRSVARPRLMRDLTVPREAPVASATSS